ncbi:hypothetical protein R1flu_006769 [Riccia fluitans]|uniref:Cytochrome P450 n=1 Tax=Riccia fluitans TaxID=41844 RepID=A0ABD1YXT3_9MARC
MSTVTTIGFVGFATPTATTSSLKRNLSSYVVLGGASGNELRKFRSIKGTATSGRRLQIRSTTSLQDATTTKINGLPVREIPGSYGPAFWGAFSDKIAYYWTEGVPRFYENRRDKYNSTVYRMNTVPGPPFFPDPRVIVLLDQKSYRTLFDVEKVEKTNVFTGTYMPSLDYTGGYRVLPYLDPSEEKHSLLKEFCFEVLKSSGRRVFPEFHKALNEVFEAWETGLKNSKDRKIKFMDALSVETLRFNVRAFLEADPVDPNTEASLGKEAVGIIRWWTLPQIMPIAVLSLPIFFAFLLAPLFELLLHTFPLPFSLVKSKRQKIVDFFRANSKEVLDMAETRFGLDRNEALENLIFYTCFNSWGGINFLFPAIIGRLGSTSAEFQRELSAEVRKAIEENGGLNPAALSSMPLVQSAVYEVMRIQPPVPFQYGRAKKDLIIESHDAAFRVKKGEMLAGYMPLAHKDPKVFTDPEGFNPKRFMEEEGEKLVQHLLWSNGSQTETPTVHNKQCPGKNFITIIAQLLVAEIYSKYETISVDGDTLVALNRASSP